VYITKKLLNLTKKLHKKHTYHQTGNQYAVFRIGLYVRRLADIFCVICSDGVHNCTGAGSFGILWLLQILQKIGLQLVFIFTVLLELGREVVVVGRGESIYGVVDQLSQCVVIQQP